MKALAIILMIVTMIPAAAAENKTDVDILPPIAAAANDDLTTVSDITPAALAERMPADLRHMAADIIRICKREGVKAEFIAAIIIWEKRPDLHNYFGWMASGKLKRFETDLDCLEWTIPKIRKLYLDAAGKYFNGATVAGVSICYNNSDFWRDNISATMEALKD